MIAALFVESDGVYQNLPSVDAWDITRDARKYNGPYPVVAHPPCQRWGRFWHGSTRKPHQYKLGDDDGCFEAAFNALKTWGGVLEHPADSHAWKAFGITRPPRNGGWKIVHLPDWKNQKLPMFTCCVYQGHYGNMSGKPTWLLTAGIGMMELPKLRFGKTEQRLHPVALERYGYEKARRIGMMAMIGGKDKTKIRNATPIPFRDILLSMAGSIA